MVSCVPSTSSRTWILHHNSKNYLQAAAEAKAETSRQQLAHETEMFKRARAHEIAEEQQKASMQAREHERRKLEHDIASDRYAAEQRADIARISLEVDLVRQRRMNEEAADHVARLVQAGVDSRDITSFLHSLPIAQAISSGIAQSRSFVCDGRTFNRMFWPLGKTEEQEQETSTEF